MPISPTERLRRRQWLRILVALLVVLVVGVIVARSVEGEMRGRLHADLDTVLRADVTAIEVWLDNQRQIADALADSMVMRQDLPELLRAAEPNMSPDRLAELPSLLHLREHLGVVVNELGYEDFLVLDLTGRVVGATQDRELGSRDFYDATPAFRDALSGGATVSRPFRHPHRKQPGEETLGDPVMYAVAPFRDESGAVVAALGFGIEPADDFTRILRVARSGETGETYAFDKTGVMLSDSKFADDLVEAGILEKSEESGAILRVQLRNPGGDLTEGYEAPVSWQALPLTKAAASAISGQEGVDVDGYLDYRGVEVIGAWTWIDHYDFGVVTEIDKQEAYSPLHALRLAFGVLFGLALLSVVGALVVATWWDVARRRASRFERQAQQLGSYTLVKKIGAGGMGEVWLARHALLRRATAVKLLPPEKSSRESIGRFEREVQLTSGLSHPNTISIYDYGHTPEGIFYYAMEYLHGIPLSELVETAGPLSCARVIHVLKQACGSLYEAHQTGLIHRDIKPANIMLCEVGGLLDFVKVLDFGLVKDFAGGREGAELSQSGVITGTPAYIAPEMVSEDHKVGPAADIYALASVAYYLLTGQQVFDCTNAVDQLVAHATKEPKRPSTRTARPIDPDLEALIMACLAKDPAARPKTMLVLAEQLEDLTSAQAWGQREARAWWQTHGPRLETRIDLAKEDLPMPAGAAMDIEISGRGRPSP